jgi:hypothetical protein
MKQARSIAGMIPHFSLGMIRLDRVRQKNAGTEQRNKRGGQLKHRTQSLNQSVR